MRALPGRIETYRRAGGDPRVIQPRIERLEQNIKDGRLDAAKRESLPVFNRLGITVTAIGVPPANIPALAYRVQVHDKTIVFSSDQNGSDPSFVEFVRGADVLVMHLAIPAGGSSPLHASPAVVGRVARDAGVGRLVVSHIGQFDLDAAIADVKKSYTGPVTVGADLQCTPVP